MQRHLQKAVSLCPPANATNLEVHLIQNLLSVIVGLQNGLQEQNKLLSITIKKLVRCSMVYLNFTSGVHVHPTLYPYQVVSSSDFLLIYLLYIDIQSGIIFRYANWSKNWWKRRFDILCRLGPQSPVLALFFGPVVARVKVVHPTASTYSPTTGLHGTKIAIKYHQLTLISRLAADLDRGIPWWMENICTTKWRLWTTFKHPPAANALCGLQLSCASQKASCSLQI